ncbi:4-hydroxy-2-oxoheptanedioate aldolase [Uliginosibacterium sp. sgz301328]|uniref:4-hydroxy-2-oxoheptanedioate aldolase n=1 Tax=Uliginosibacterium sp. sgz301328 TaxID=3243764 RepID=UPI00359CE0D0
MTCIPHNPFKAAIQSGQTQLGLWVTCANAYVAEISAGAGYDWLLMDAEHGPNDIPSLLLQLQAVAPYPGHPIVRPANADPALIKQVLDIGAQTLLIPMVDTAEDARNVVSAMRYAPRGIRGVGATIARASRWGRVRDYLQRTEEELCLLVQVETRRGLENLDDIVCVEGVDGVFIGPADLSASLGHLGDAGHPDVQGAIEDAIRRIRAAGKAAGFLAPDPDMAKKALSWGANFVAVAVDTMLYTRALADALEPFRGVTGDSKGPLSY